MYGDKILEFALSKIDIQFRHMGRNDFGYDCAGLYLEALKTIDKFDERMDLKSYGRSPEGFKIVNILNEFFERINYEDMKNGDLMLFTFIKNPQHIAIYENFEGNDYMIHAYGDPSINKVIKNRLDAKWKERFNAAYRIK